MEDKKFAIELEVITPLSVGAGNDNDWMRGIDYIQKDGKVYILNIHKMASQGIDIGRLASLFEKSDDGGRGISQLIGNKLEDVSEYVFDAQVSTNNPIKTFLRTKFYGKPVVAGSSIKGSIRSALFHYLHENDENTNEEVFGSMKDGTDLMRFVRIADIEMPSTELVNTKIFNLRREGSEWFGGWKHAMNETSKQYRPNGFNTLYECVLPGKKGLGSISLAGRAFELMAANSNKYISHSAKKHQLLSDDIRDLFGIINQVTRTYLLKEKDFFVKYPAERSDEVIDNVNALLGMIPDDGSSCLLKMSAGVGFHSITGDWQYEDYSQTKTWTFGRDAGKKKYKSRKTAEYNRRLQLMGFVKLRALTVDEVNQYTQSLNAEHARIVDNIMAPIRQYEAERLKREEKERLHQLAIEEKKRKEKAWNELMEQARQFYRESLWDDAISKADEAIAIYPESQEAISLRSECLQAKSLQAFNVKVQDEAFRKFTQPLARVIEGKSSVGNLIGTTAKWIKTQGNVFGEAEYLVFLDEARKLPVKEQKKFKSRTQDLQKAIGTDMTNRFISEIGV